MKQIAEFLGHKVRDKVTKFEGIVTSIAFDLYGCVQAIVHPGLDKDGKPADQHWFDTNRLEVLSKKPVMNVPMFGQPVVAVADKGPAEKPRMAEGPR